MIAGNDENSPGVEADRLAKSGEIAACVVVLLAGSLARAGEGVAAKGDIAGNEDRFRGRGALPEDRGDIPLQLTGDEYLVPAVGGVAVPNMEIGDVDPR